MSTLRFTSDLSRAFYSSTRRWRKHRASTRFGTRSLEKLCACSMLRRGILRSPAWRISPPARDWVLPAVSRLRFSEPCMHTSETWFILMSWLLKLADWRSMFWEKLSANKINILPPTEESHVSNLEPMIRFGLGLLRSPRRRYL